MSNFYFSDGDIIDGAANYFLERLAVEKKKTLRKWAKELEEELNNGWEDYNVKPKHKRKVKIIPHIEISIG